MTKQKTLTVGELIQLLQNYQPDLKVVAEWDGSWSALGTPYTEEGDYLVFDVSIWGDAE